jgi:hypothetical protein
VKSGHDGASLSSTGVGDTQGLVIGDPSVRTARYPITPPSAHGRSVPRKKAPDDATARSIVASGWSA